MQHRQSSFPSSRRDWQTAVKRIGLWFLTASLLAGCSLLDVTTERSPRFDPARYKTYAWSPLEQERSELMTSVEKAIERELQNKGYSKAADTADFVLTYRINIVQKQASASISQDNDSLFDTSGSSVPAYYYTYQEGSIQLYAVDAALQQRIWLGLVKGQLGLYQDAQKSAERLDKAIRLLLEEFPLRET